MYVSVTLVVVVVELAAFRAVIVAPVTAALIFPVTAHAAASVVKKIGIWVFGVGPHVWSSTANVAPAFAPNNMVYSSTTCSPQLVPFPAGLAVTLVTNCATSAKTAATRPALKSSGMPAMVSVGALRSTPALTPTRRRAVRTTPEL